ncbi:hypothetical protein DRF65_24105 [Chryseobacterium pennae]|uniref:Lipoprotein n=1 Tax=Chryseobacterium pennae TaxID=2258962 RepID=A0A3D9C1Y6_9FLAO|nr:hypothetical protein [Chryseobacterium pennae]REC59814.1 hypothetical protein DRF65_24105 [Chryseobacterium pennae]
MYKILILCFLLLLSCRKKDKEIDYPENYILTEKAISKDCHAFQMRFNEGDFILNFSLSGYCHDIKMNDYIKEYSKYLNQYRSRFKVREGYINFNYYGIKETKVLQDSIIEITARSFKSPVFLSESSEKNFVIKVSPLINR